MGKKIPYVHCFNHRLHLVVVKLITSFTCVDEFFEMCSLTQKNLKHSNISKIYEGTKLCRLLETRWSGHLSMTKAILRNYTEILNVLEKVKGCSFVGEDKATALGLMMHLKKKNHFDFY